jgi:N6-L-threonylcarbamoyladenine synthase
MLIEIPAHLTYKILGETLDDAVGEVFDKVARMLGLPYPGGPHVSRIAKEGDSKTFDFPRPMMNSKNLDFSYSGLKTAVLYQVQDLGEKLEGQKNNIAASFEVAVVDSLTAKLIQAAQHKKYKAILLAGGVAANVVLQKRVQQESNKLQIPLLLAPATLCGDNATMIGQAGVFAYQAGRTKTWREVDATARVSIEEFSLEQSNSYKLSAKS